MRYFFTLLLAITLLPSFVKGQALNAKAESNWWSVCNNSTIDKLLSCAMENNHDVITAANNILLARSSWRASQGGFYPSISLNAGYISEKTSRGITDVDKRDQIGEVTINATWEIDIFGSIRHEAQNKKALYVASEMQYNSVMISLCGQIIEEYCKLRALQTQLNIAIQNRNSQQAITQLTEDKFQNGLVTALDAAQAKSLLLQTQATIPGIEYSITEQINTLKTLANISDKELLEELRTSTLLDNPPAILYNGVNADVIRNRPDIKQAEAELKALTHAAGAAKADYWPKFLITAQFGYGSHQFSHLTEYENMVWQVEPAIKWNIFSGRETTQAKRAAIIQIDEGVNSLNKVISNALQDIENCLSDIKATKEQYVATVAAVQQLQTTYNLAQNLYKEGLTDYQNVMSAQKSLLSAQESCVNLQLALWQATAALYVATGGGWNLNLEQQ
ncbi:MAG: efflux transporter outer membrane subunit [Odoribacter sp.]|nr:efflux transporter outer membrane subunit [Bacteroidales bacterium]MBR2981186.1 efflux transporter outer membrane subunit [Odoribacter sp.]